MVFIGIDPSITNTGIVLLNGGTPCCYKIEWQKVKGKEYYRTKTKGTNGERVLLQLIGTKTKNEETRIGGLYYSICKLLHAFLVDYGGYNIQVGIERPMGANRGSGQLVAMAYAAAIIATHQIAIQVMAFTPTELKKFITGKGNSKKQIIIQQVYKKYGVEFEDDNLADAFVLAKMAEAAHANR